jgi:hypothetical protein
VADATERIGTAHIPTVRNADLPHLLNVLNEQQARKIDMVVPGDMLHFRDGLLHIFGQEMILEDDGFTDPNGRYWPTQTFDDQIAERLDITPSYLRKLRHGRTDRDGKQTAASRLDLWDANVNGLLGGRKPLVRRPAFTEPGTEPAEPEVIREGVPADPRSFFVRLIRSGEDGVGIARSIHSNKFGRMDHIDGLMAMLAGITAAGVDPATLRIYGDISESRMYVHVAAPEILAAAPNLLEGYRSPFDSRGESGRRRTVGYTVEQRVEMGRRFRESGRAGLPEGITPGFEPLVHAGFLLANSETGSGRWTIVPEVTILWCTNGATMNKDGFARNHIGARLDDGVVEWSADTQSKELALVTAQTRDVVATALSADYLEAKVAELEVQAGNPIAEPEKAIEVVAKKLSFTKEQQEGILRHFLMGGQLTSGGVMQAVTSFSQTLDDPDTAHDLNSRAIEAMELAYLMDS